VWFRLEARYVDTTDRRRRSVLLFEGLALILLALFLGKLVFLEYGNDTTSVIGRSGPGVRGARFLHLHGGVERSALADPLRRRSGGCVATARVDPGGVDAIPLVEPVPVPCSSRWSSSASSSGGSSRKPITDATASTIVDGWALFTPRLEVTKTPSVNVNWTGAGPDRKSEAYIVERRESTEPGFARVETLVAGTTTWEDRKVARGKDVPLPRDHRRRLGRDHEAPNSASRSRKSRRRRSRKQKPKPRRGLTPCRMHGAAEPSPSAPTEVADRTRRSTSSADGIPRRASSSFTGLESSLDSPHTQDPV
jgi:hypothetical protein